jgi:peptidoglycan hydrolase-like protein with peptidoglycan-binding domain
VTSDNDLPSVEGLHEGDSGDEVRRVQRYLERFGYLDSAHLDGFGVARDRAAAPAATEGAFDQNTTTALRAFQEKFGLPVTGVLDHDTLQLMSQPRCGFPDVAEYVLPGTKWDTNSLTYGFSEFTPDLTEAEIRAAVTQAFGLWEAVSPLPFTEAPSGTTPDIVIRFVPNDHGDTPFGSNLAHAFYPTTFTALGGDSHFNEAYVWSVSLPPSGIDLVTVAGHEFGHALGLAHTTAFGALMLPFYGGPHRYLHADDIGGIQILYIGWEDLGGISTDGVAVSSWGLSRIDCFAVGVDRAVWHRPWQNSAWGAWESLGGELYSAPAAVSWGPDRIDIFALGGDRAVWHKAWYGSSWSGWEDLGGFWTDGVAVCSSGVDRLDCFTVGTDRAVWHKAWDGSSWSNWESLGGQIYSAPAAVSYKYWPDRIDVFGLGANRAVQHQVWDGSVWSGWEDLGGFSTEGVGASGWSAGSDPSLPTNLDCFTVGTDKAIWHRKWDGTTWSAWESLGAEAYSAPAAVSRTSRTDICFLGANRQVLHMLYPPL